ncbi:TlpA family protein disulfide reductase [Herbaspirillum camelliae]|uniref:TlpA family protein disulfide reductase n=1 Tax=Herbaspirillum camelliae TaxID=1892903 RepID=UPI000949EDA4|nr:TlpA disulfide reductase family protein [Herbaspirillum camelliae]
MQINELLVGDPAPALEIECFLKGKPIQRFERGSVYVIEFWATWCAPCKASIPHLSSLQQHYPEVCILGIAVGWKDADIVEVFVREQGDAISYRIALDRAGNPGERYSRSRLVWCEAAYQQGVPSAFIVDRDGRIAWMGHPQEIDHALSAIVNGDWDLEQEAEAHRRWLTDSRVREARRMEATVSRLLAEDRRADAIAVYHEAFGAYPVLEASYGLAYFKLLLAQTGDAAMNYAHRLVNEIYPESFPALLYVAERLLEKTVLPERDGLARESADLALLALLKLESVLSTEANTDMKVQMRISCAISEALLTLGNIAEARVRMIAVQELSAKLGEAPVQRVEELLSRISANAGALPMECDGNICIPAADRKIGL